MTTIDLVLLYLLLGVVVTVFRPTPRSILRKCFQHESQTFSKSLAILICCVIAFAGVVLWPVIWITNIRAASSEKETLAEIRSYLIRQARTTAASDELLRTYYHFIVRQIKDVAKERSEKLSSSTIKNVALDYLGMWAGMSEQQSAFGWHVMLSRGKEIYRAEGVEALLEFLREKPALKQTREPPAETPLANEQLPGLFGGGIGDSFETAVVVNAKNPLVGVQAEYRYVANQCGEPHKDWELQSQALREHGGKPYDVLTVALTGGETRTFYFDIAKFLGK